MKLHMLIVCKICLTRLAKPDPDAQTEKIKEIFNLFPISVHLYIFFHIINFNIADTTGASLAGVSLSVCASNFSRTNSLSCSSNMKQRRPQNAQT